MMVTISSSLQSDSITLGSTISEVAILRFKRREGGYDSLVYGVENGPDLLLGSNTQYNVDA